MPIRPTNAVAANSTRPATMSPARKMFWQSPYTNADAKVVQDKKSLPSLDAAKEFIGNAIITKKEAQLGAMGVTRYRFDDQDCLTRFQRSGFSSSDVKEAKKAFDFLKGKSDTEVKGYLGLKLRNKEVGYNGGMEMLKAAGITEDKYDAHEQMDAFKSSGMGDRQVREAKAKFDFLKDSSTTMVKQYLGLKVINAKDGNDDAKQFLKDIGAPGGWGR